MGKPVRSLSDYEDDWWLDRFLSCGIPESYLTAWFSNYKAETQAQKSVLDQVKAASGTERPIVLLGRFGVGKTHLAVSALKNTLISRTPEKPLIINKDAEGKVVHVRRNVGGRYKKGRYYTVSSLFREFREHIKSPEGSESKFFKFIRSLDCMVIDELGIRSNSDAENRFIQEVFDERYSNPRQTIVCANLTIEEMEGVVGERVLKERFKQLDALVLVMNWGSYRRRAANVT